MAYSVLVLLPLPYPVLGALFALPWVALALARVPVGEVLRSLVPVAVLALFAAAFAVVGDPGLAGAVKGAVLGLRMVCLVGASLAVCLTTTSTDLLVAFTAFLGPLGRLGVPVRDVAFTLALAVRFMPLIAQEFHTVRRAQAARGGDLRGLGPFRRLQVMGSAFTAVLVGLFRHADGVAVAMDARCYGALEAQGAPAPAAQAEGAADDGAVAA